MGDLKDMCLTILERSRSNFDIKGTHGKLKNNSLYLETPLYGPKSAVPNNFFFDFLRSLYRGEKREKVVLVGFIKTLWGFQKCTVERERVTDSRV